MKVKKHIIINYKFSSGISLINKRFNCVNIVGLLLHLYKAKDYLFMLIIDNLKKMESDGS